MDNDDCLYLPDAGLAGCAFHHWDDDRRWSYHTGTPGDCAGPGDPPPSADLETLARDVVELLPWAATVAESEGKDATARTLRGLVDAAKRALR